VINHTLRRLRSAKSVVPPKISKEALGSGTSMTPTESRLSPASWPMPLGIDIKKLAVPFTMAVPLSWLSKFNLCHSSSAFLSSSFGMIFLR